MCMAHMGKFRLTLMFVVESSRLFESCVDCVSLCPVTCLLVKAVIWR